MESFKKVAGVFLMLLSTIAISHPYYLGNFTGTETENPPTITNGSSMFALPDYESKLAKIGSSIPLDYNGTVRSYIELYVNRSPALSEKILSLSDIYFPIFEKYLRQYNLPLELKYLPVTESALNSQAVSPAGATGLWQIMGITAKGLHLNVDNYVDDRRDPHKSTEAAVKLLQSMYKKYDDWLLVIAAYNCGPGRIDEAIRRSGGIRDYWLLYDYLPRETRNYVPAFVACVYWMHYHLDHSLKLYPHPYANIFTSSDTLMVRGPLHLNAVAKTLNMDVEKLAFMNPALKKRFLPENHQPYCLRLPVTEIWTFKQKRELIYADSRSQSGGANLTEKVTADVWHKVKQGETLSSIAAKHKCTVAQLKKWNKLSTTNLKVGAKLKVGVKSVQKEVSAIPIKVPSANTNINPPIETQPAYVVAESVSEPELADANSNIAPTPNQPAAATKTEEKRYKVKKGETLIAIAKSNGCKVEDLKKWNNLSSATLTVGQNLVVGFTHAPVTQPNNEPDEIEITLSDDVIITPEGDIIFKDQMTTSVVALYEPHNSSIEDDNFKIDQNIVITANGDIIIKESYQPATTTATQQAAPKNPDVITFNDDNIIITENGDIIFKEPDATTTAPSISAPVTTTATQQAAPKNPDVITFNDDNIIITENGDIIFKEPDATTTAPSISAPVTTTATQQAAPKNPDVITFNDDNIIITENGDIIFKEPDATTTAPTTTANPIATGDIIITENGEIIIGGEIPDEISYRAATPRANTAKKTQEPAAITYKVKKGDSYWSIARNANTTVATLLKLNNLTEKSVMQPGMTLLLPAKK